MSIIWSALKWAGFIVLICILSVVGFGFAVWLFPGNPSRFYFIVAGVTGVLAIMFRPVPKADEE